MVLLSIVGLSQQNPIAQPEIQDNTQFVETVNRNLRETINLVEASNPGVSANEDAEVQLIAAAETELDSTEIDDENTRSKKEIELNEISAVIDEEEKQNNEETLNTAESHIFRPVFRYRSAFAERRRIRKRLTTTP